MTGPMRALSAAMVMAMTLVFQAAPRGQEAFEVASIKENKDIAGGGSLRIMPDGGIRTVHISARTFVAVAYRLQPFQLVGAPAWLSEVYYDLNAKPEGKVSRADRLLPRGGLYAHDDNQHHEVERGPDLESHELIGWGSARPRD